MKTFEVPYGFETCMIDFYQRRKQYIRFIYLPPYKDDNINTRTTVEQEMPGNGGYMPRTRMEYEKHLKAIVDAGLQFVVLWQTQKPLPLEMVKYYVSLGASGFIVATDEAATIIKNYDKNLIVVCSIVQRIVEGIASHDFSLYDYIVLFFPFNRSLSVLKKLKHLKDKLVIMPNAACPTECPAMHHWFPPNGKVDNITCYTHKHKDRCGYIFPEHLYLFDDYVCGYKLQGRDYNSVLLQYTCNDFFNRKSEGRSVITGSFRQFLLKELERLGTEAYYDVKSPDIIDKV